MEIAGVKIQVRNVSRAVSVMLDGYRINGCRGLSTIAFCEAQVAHMLAAGITSNNTIIDEYRNQIELERVKL